MTAMNPTPRRKRVSADRALAFIASLVLAVTLHIGVSRAQTGPLEDLAAFPQGKLEIIDDKVAGKKAKHVFEVWLADTPGRQAQGLMFVRDLPDLRGMLFVHEQSQEISMWMKNTYIPLDMVFISDQGRIQQIIEQAKPHSLAIIRSDKPAFAVLE